MADTHRRIPRPLLSKMALLEARLGQTTFPQFVPREKFDASDAVGIQKVARLMAAHVGLADLCFIITFAKQKDGIGGHIELNHASKDVFVEIDNSYEGEESVLAVLAHEIAHKFLHRRGISLPETQANEELTDLATVYMGFGKLSLNGCEVTKQRFDGNRQTERTWKVGYLGLDQFALAYYIYVVAQQLTGEDAMDGLSVTASNALHNVFMTFSWLPEVRTQWSSDPTELDDPWWHQDLVLLRSIGDRIRNQATGALNQYHHKKAALKAKAGSISTSGTIPLVQAIECEAEAMDLREGTHFGGSRAPILGFFNAIQWNALSGTDMLSSAHLQISCPRCDINLRAPNSPESRILRCPKCALEFSFAGPPFYLRKSTGETAKPESAASSTNTSWISRLFSNSQHRP